MFFGLAVATSSVGMCGRDDNSSAYWGILLYTSYAILFGNFFFESYLNPKGDRNKKRDLINKAKQHLDTNGNYPKSDVKSKQG